MKLFFRDIVKAFSNWHHRIHANRFNKQQNKRVAEKIREQQKDPKHKQYWEDRFKEKAKIERMWLFGREE